jgi:protein O-GlcNAc transferase
MKLREVRKDHPPLDSPGASRVSAGTLPPQLQARLVEALGHHQRGELRAAETLYREVLLAQPRCFDALHLSGVAATQRGAFDEGIALIRRAIAVDETQANAWFSLARALLEQRDAIGALAACDALAAMQPQNAEVWFLRGNALQLGGAHEEAVDSYAEALRLQPNYPAALNNQGHSLRILRRTGQALAVFARALELQPAYTMALNNQGLALLDLRRVPEALSSFDDALRLQPAFVEVLSNRGTALFALKRFAEAAETFERLAAVAPNLGGALGNFLYARRNCCDWREHESLAQRITAAVQRGECTDVPLSFMCVSDSPQAQLTCARTFTAARYPQPKSLLPQSLQPRRPPAHGRIRIAYLSGDFGEHAVSYLLAGVIERHDTSRFDTIAVAWGRQNDGLTRKRLETAFGRFIDATEFSDADIAMQLRDLEIDIAIDLTGHTGGQRTGIFALRAAPLQVNYLGFPGTSGAPYMDYIIADPTVVPDGEESAYSECVARLPDCYLPNDDRRSVGRETITRSDAHLPESGFVFCAFNNPVKITPAVFGVWMELLRQIPGSVLWLRAGVLEARRNLERAAERQGIAPARLVFAAAVDSIESHLARHRLADLFLDTLPYNGHTTTCDALWSGLPVLTCSGRSFASRVGRSALQALGLPELITDNLESYAQVALALARDPARLGSIRERLAEHRRTSALFDTTRYCRRLEAAYVTMRQRLRMGLSPAGFTVPVS